MTFDPVRNFAYSTVSVAPSPADSGLTVELADPALFPDPVADGAFNLVVWPADAALPLDSNAEIIRATGLAAGVFPIDRAQEGSTARAILVGDQVALAVTAKTLTDLQAGTGTFASSFTTDADTFIGSCVIDLGTDSAFLAKLAITGTQFVADSEVWGTGSGQLQVDVLVQQSVDGVIYYAARDSAARSFVWPVSVVIFAAGDYEWIYGPFLRFIRVTVTIVDDNFDVYAGANHPTATFAVTGTYITSG